MGFISDIERTIKSAFRLGQNWLKSSSGKLIVRNSNDDANASLVCEDIEISGNGITLNADASNVGSDRSVRIQRSPNATASYTLTLPPSAGNTGDIVALISPGILSFAPLSGGSGGDAGSVGGFTASQLRDRANHTGTQAASTITGLGSAAFASASNFAASNDPRLSTFTATQAGLVPNPGTGTNRYLREDGTWQTISGGGSGSGDFINGGNSPSGDLILGTNNNFALNFETNNLSRLSISASGAINIWDGQNRHAVPNNNMLPGSLTIGSTNRNYGGGNNWNSNTAGLLFECSDNTEIAIHDANTRLASLFYYESSPHRVTWGRNMGWGIINQYHFLNRSMLVSHQTSFNFNNLNLPLDENQRTNLIIAGTYPHLYLISNQSGNSSHSNGISFAEMLQGSSNTARQWHFAQASWGRFFQIGYVESTDFNPHLGIQNWGTTTLLSIVAPGHSTNLGNRAGISLNGKFDPEYHLDINEGSIGWGVNNTRTERKNNAGQSDSLSTKQSGFFDADSPSNFYPNANGWQHLIDCRHGNSPSFALQIATGFGNNFSSGIWWRATGGNATQSWNRILNATPNNESNAWLSAGNNNVDAGQHFVGTLNNSDLVFRRNNIEAFRVPSQNVIQVNCQNGFGNPSRPHYSFYWNWGEDDGMYLESNGVLCFSVEGTKRFSISSPNNRIEAHGFSFRTDQGYFVNGDRVINSKSGSTINNLNGSASLNDVINTLNSLLSVLRDHHDLFN